MTLYYSCLVVFFTAAASQEKIHTLYCMKGDTMVLQCPVNHKSLQWIKFSYDEELGTIYSEKRVLNRNLPHVKRLAITGNFSIGQYILNIGNFTKGDEGVYMCFVPNENRVQNYSIHVQLTKLPSDIRWLSGVTNYNGSYDKICTEQQTCNITCIVDSGIPPEVLFISDETHLYAVGGPGTLRYTFIPTKQDHLKEFICMTNISTKDIQLESRIKLNIQYRPVVSIISVPSTDITEGSNVSIVCKSDANPKVLDLQLLKDGLSVLHTDSDYNSLDMKNFTRSHAGNYRCICRNIIGANDDEIQLNVLYAPNVKIIKQSSNGRVYLRCKANGYPTIYRYLLWEHKTMFGEHIRYLEGDSSGNLYLDANNPDTKYQDNGIYICKVENGITNNIGNLVQIATMQFIRDEPPVFVSDNNNVQYGTSGKSTRIVTYIYGHPDYHTLCCSSQNWTMCQDSHSYAFEEQVTLVRDTFHGVVVLLQGYQVSFVTAILKPVDFTLYAFEVRNGLGTGKLLVQLKHLIEDPNAECLNTDKSQATIYVSVLIMMIFIILIFSVYHIILVKRVKNQTNKNKDNVVSVESQYEEIQMEEAGTNDVLRRSIECLAPELNEGSRSIECLAPELNEGPSSSDDYDDNYLDERSVSGSIESEDKRGESQYESFEKNQDEQYLSNHAYTEGRLSDTFVKDVIEG